MNSNNGSDRLQSTNKVRSRILKARNGIRETFHSVRAGGRDRHTSTSRLQTMHHFVLLFEGSASQYKNDVRRIRRLPQVSVIDETPELGMLLVEGRQPELQLLVSTLRGWSLEAVHVMEAAGR